MAAINSSSQQFIPEFNGENYEFWSVKMKTIFRSLKQWEIIEKGYKEPSEDEVISDADQKNLEKLRQTDASALSIIQRAVTKAIFPRIMRANTAKEAWDILQGEYLGDAKVRTIKLQTLRRELENIKMKEDETLNDFFYKIF